ncbi:MAG: GGDEF domain-containing protein [Methylotenera sp.]|nr:GGDEF domain-containing protein [Methylotenera sp.]
MIIDLNKKSAIEAAKLQQLLSVSPASLVTSTLLAVILTYVQHETMGLSVILIWFLFVVLAALARTTLVVAYRRPLAKGDPTIHERLIRFRAGVLLAGVAWGFAGFWMFPASDPQHRMLLVFILAGLSAGGVISLAYDFVSAMIFTVTVILPLTLQLLVAGDALSLGMGVAAMLYLCFIIMSLRLVNRGLTQSTIVQLEATAREDAMRLSEERYRLLLHHSPMGIFHYDTNLVVTYCNDRLAYILNMPIDRIVNLDINTLNDQSILVALNKALVSQTGYYEGLYSATFSDFSRWISLTCTPSFDINGNVVGGIAVAQDISERKQATDKVEKFAFFDYLTGLPNRRLLLDRLKQAFVTGVRGNQKGALLFLDLDHFKTLNDTRGHDIGDLLLQQVATRLLACVRAGDTVARIGGDEFVLLLEDLSEKESEAILEIEAIGEKILTALNQPYLLAEHEFYSTASVGATLFTGHEREIEAILKQADIAMYQAKKAGRNTVSFFKLQAPLQ